jgi:hypothetical protein
MFVRDIAPELAKDEGFQIARERPGQLLFGDGVVPTTDMESPLEGEPAQEEPWIPSDIAAVTAVGREPFLRRLSAEAASDGLPSVLARRLHVDFSPERTGTNVHVHGHVERNVCHGLELLGTPQHWPEIADRPHD